MGSRSSPPSRRRLLKALIGVGVGTVSSAAGWGFFYERGHLELTHTQVPVAGLPPALAGLRIALLADFHRSALVSAAVVERAAALAREARPDVIVLGGDYVTRSDRRFVGPAAEALASLSAPLGVFAILGNHDDERDMPAALARQGFTVLRDARTRLTVRGEQVDLVGIRYWTRGAADLARLLKGARGFPILLAHDPRRLSQAASLGIPLVLSGHTHGGQVVIPGVGAPAGRKFPVVAGLGFQGQTTLFVTRGIGTVYVPVRINCPPEVAVLTLARQTGS